MASNFGPWWRSVLPVGLYSPCPCAQAGDGSTGFKPALVMNYCSCGFERENGEASPCKTWKG